jgi:putative hemolysin
MSIVEPKEFVTAKLSPSIGAAKVLMSLLRLNKVNKIYNSSNCEDAILFLDNILGQIGVTYEVSADDLAKIPRKGPFVIVSNHPFGIIDGLVLLRSVLPIRPDFKVMANFVLQRIKPLESYFLGVNPFEGQAKTSFSGFREAVGHLSAGMPLGVFPAGEVSSFNKDFPGLTDKKWDGATLKLIYNAKVPVVPLFFKGSNSWLFHVLGMLNPTLRTAKLPSEALNKRNKPIKVRIGAAITPKEQREYAHYKELGRHVRAIVYALGSTIHAQKLYAPAWQKAPSKEPLSVEIDRYLQKVAVRDLDSKGHKLFGLGKYEVYCAPAKDMGLLMYEIGRLREMTFREVGEGTNRCMDIDEFDSYYRQLFVWDSEAGRIIGGYRIGFGKEIQYMYGRTGFYTHSLFGFQKSFKPVLDQSMELGRAFVVQEYQRKSMPLFLLWKGILYTLLKNDEYRFLIGPVSISNDFTQASKKLIIEFIKKYYFAEEYSSCIKPRNKVKLRPSSQDLSFLVEQTEGCLSKLDSSVRKLEINGQNLPVLMRKYLEMNGKIIGFNLDPAFNNCIDGLLLMDLHQIPVSVIQGLSKEIEDSALLNGLLERLEINK